MLIILEERSESPKACVQAHLVISRELAFGVKVTIKSTEGKFEALNFSQPLLQVVKSLYRSCKWVANLLLHQVFYITFFYNKSVVRRRSKQTNFSSAHKKQDKGQGLYVILAYWIDLLHLYLAAHYIFPLTWERRKYGALYNISVSCPVGLGVHREDSVWLTVHHPWLNWNFKLFSRSEETKHSNNLYSGN